MGLGAGQIVYENDLSILPGSVIARGDRGVLWGPFTPATNTDLGVVRLDNVAMRAGYSYRVEGRCRCSTATVTERSALRIRWTDTGVAATTGSAELERAELQAGAAGNTIHIVGYVHPTVDILASFLLIFLRVGTSQMSLAGDNGSYGRLMVTTIGPTAPDTGVDV